MLSLPASVSVMESVCMLLSEHLQEVILSIYIACDQTIISLHVCALEILCPG